MSTIPAPPNGLVSALRAGRAVAIVGSGLSCAAGAPSWKALLLGLAAEADDIQPHERSRLAKALAAMESGRFLDAASVLKSVLDGEFQGAIVRQLRQRQRLVMDEEVVAGRRSGPLFKERGHPEPISLRPTVSHWYLAQIGFRAVITTNYDSLIEDAWPLPRPAAYSWSYEDLIQHIQRGEQFILKIHGDERHPGDMILAREDYGGPLFNSRARGALKALLATSQPFWIGYGHNDPDLDLLLDACRAELGVTGGYTVALRDDELLCLRLKNAHITASLLGSHAEVPLFLRRLAEHVGSRLLFTVRVSMEWPGAAEARRLGQELAWALGPLAGEMEPWGVEPHPLQLHLTASADGVRKLRMLCEQRAPELMELLVRRRVTALDGIEIGDPPGGPAGAVGGGSVPSIVHAFHAAGATHASSGWAPVRAAAQRAATPQQRPQLTIELRRRGAELARAYHFPLYGEDDRFGSRQRFDEIGQSYRAGRAVGLAALHGVLERGLIEEMEAELAGAQLARAGEALFEALFGPEEERWSMLLRRAFEDGGAPSPIHRPLRVRLRVEDPLLSALPWRAVRWRGHVLSEWGWTFELCSSTATSERIEHQSPGRILILIPGATPEGLMTPDLGTEAHRTELTELFERISSGYARSEQLQIARSWAELESACAYMRPHLVYAHCHGAMLDGEPSLRVGSQPGDWIAVRRLSELFRAHPPHAVALNVSWAVHEAWPLSAAMLQEIPFVISVQAAPHVAPARRFVLEWLRAWLGDGLDPVKAAHQPLEGAALSARGLSILHARYDTWVTRRAIHAPIGPVADAEDWFDRDKQRAILFKHVSDLARGERQRVEAIIAYARPGNAPECFSQQVIDYIDREAGDRLHIRRIRLRLPEQENAALHPDLLEHGLKAQLGYEATASLDLVLRARAPSPKGWAARVLWLDWGVLRDRKEFRKDVFAWLEFARDRLSRWCPDELRVVAALALEAEDEVFKRLHDHLPGLRALREFRTERFRCTAAEPLDAGSLTDVLDFLDRHGCDGAVREMLADAIFARTAGRYEETRSLLREGLRLGWHALLGQLGARTLAQEAW
ncbi:hypothetical protein sce6216 [Sorangium cellulosum So ce56]|uniref:Uncharacterized protein n=1 Tax=Sorangium cellulosum (strain So ce56) TaxID=448385 RepID=A9GGY2_SORC5|nr:SIR2 family protein [Sorangium cellulosum]CAN96383.1 hypothetical protein sce6216 [Sorangium cellulosum So ce56]